jgi:hypothetical protein
MTRLRSLKSAVARRLADQIRGGQRDVRPLPDDEWSRIPFGHVSPLTEENRRLQPRARPRGRLSGCRSSIPFVFMSVTFNPNPES